MKRKAAGLALLVVATFILGACAGQTAPPLTTTWLEPAPTATAPVTTPVTTPALPETALTPEAALQTFLEDNFRALETAFGRTTFTFKVVSNTSADKPYDYWVQVEYDPAFFYDVQTANNATMVATLNSQVVGQLRAHQDKLARAVIARMPGKKIYGGYYLAWYADPADKTKLSTQQYFSWANYSPPKLTGSYADTRIADLTWDSSADGSLLR